MPLRKPPETYIMILLIDERPRRSDRHAAQRQRRSVVDVRRTRRPPCEKPNEWSNAATTWLCLSTPLPVWRAYNTVSPHPARYSPAVSTPTPSRNPNVLRRRAQHRRRWLANHHSHSPYRNQLEDGRSHLRRIQRNRNMELQLDRKLSEQTHIPRRRHHGIEHTPRRPATQGNPQPHVDSAPLPVRPQLRRGNGIHQKTAWNAPPTTTNCSAPWATTLPNPIQNYFITR